MRKGDEESPGKQRNRSRDGTHGRLRVGGCPFGGQRRAAVTGGGLRLPGELHAGPTAAEAVLPLRDLGVHRRHVAPAPRPRALPTRATLRGVTHLCLSSLPAARRYERAVLPAWGSYIAGDPVLLIRRNNKDFKDLSPRDIGKPWESEAAPPSKT